VLELNIAFAVSRVQGFTAESSLSAQRNDKKIFGGFAGNG
jgi:hypothetical protein